MLQSIDRLAVPAIQRSRRGSAARRLGLLAPSVSTGFGRPPSFHHSEADPHRYRAIIDEVQKLRGGIYLKDGAIRPEELTQGRHRASLDWSSWHLVVLDENDNVLGCARFTPYPKETRFADLGVSRCSLARSPQWGARLQSAVESELSLARKRGLAYVELGGWALAESIRGSAEALRMVLAIYGLAQELGGVVGISTATTRHCSASILKKIGGFSLEHGGTELPAYHDSQYDCEMEVLRFHSWAPNPRFLPWIGQIKAELRSMPVLMHANNTRNLQ